MPMWGLARGRLCQVGWTSDLPLSTFAGTLLGIDVSSWLGDCPLTYFSPCDPTGLAWIWSSPANASKTKGGDCNLTSQQQLLGAPSLGRGTGCSRQMCSQ